MNDDQLTPESESAGLATTVHQLRVQLCGLGVGCLLVSMAFGVFVYKQNRELSRLVETRTQQVGQLRQFEERWLPAVQELAQHSATKPELQAIFGKYGMQLGAGTPAAPGR